MPWLRFVLAIVHLSAVSLFLHDSSSYIFGAASIRRRPALKPGQHLLRSHATIIGWNPGSTARMVYYLFG